MSAQRDLIDMDELLTFGFAECPSSCAGLHTDIELFARQLGSQSATVTLDQSDAPDRLPVHTEGIYMARPLRYFLLGCLIPALAGGETVIYDARVAAAKLNQYAPELSGVRIRYQSSRGADFAIHPLIHKGENGEVLRFRSRVASNRLLALPPGWSDDGFYDLLHDLLEESVVLKHRWRAGDILAVDNGVTLHGRESFEGRRVMLRTRVEI